MDDGSPAWSSEGSGGKPAEPNRYNPVVSDSSSTAVLTPKKPPRLGSPPIASPDLPAPANSSYVAQLAEMKRRLSANQPLVSPQHSYNSQSTPFTYSAIPNPRMSTKAAAFLERTSDALAPCTSPASTAPSNTPPPTSNLLTPTLTPTPVSGPLPSPSPAPCHSSLDHLTLPPFAGKAPPSPHLTTNNRSTSAAYLQRQASPRSSSDSRHSASSEAWYVAPISTPSPSHRLRIPRPPGGRSASNKSLASDASDATPAKRSPLKTSLLEYISSFSFRSSSHRSDDANKLNYTSSSDSWGDRSGITSYEDSSSEMADYDDCDKIGADPADCSMSLLHSILLSEEEAGRGLNDLLTSYFDSDANKERMRSNKTLSLVARVVKRFVRSHSVAEQGCLLLGLLVKYDSSMTEVRAYQLVLTAMLRAHAAADPDTPPEAAGDTTGVGVPHPLTRDSEHSEAEVADAIERVFAAHTHEDVLVLACTVVGHLAHRNDSMCRLLSDLGICEHLTLMLTAFEESAETIGCVLNAIAHIASTSEDEVKSRVGRPSACTSVLKSIKKHARNARVVERGCFAIAHIASGRDERLRNALGGSGACELVLEVMRSNSMDADIAEAACEALLSLCLSDSNRELLVSLNAESTIESLSQRLRVQSMADCASIDVS